MSDVLEVLRENALPQEWVDELRGLLDIMDNFKDNDQRARFLLNCNFLRDHGAAVAAQIALLDEELGRSS